MFRLCLHLCYIYTSHLYACNVEQIFAYIDIYTYIYTCIYTCIHTHTVHIRGVCIVSLWWCHHGNPITCHMTILIPATVGTPRCSTLLMMLLSLAMSSIHRGRRTWHRRTSHYTTCRSLIGYGMMDVRWEGILCALVYEHRYCEIMWDSVLCCEMT